MPLRNLVGSAVNELFKSQDEKRADLVDKYFGDRPVLDMLLLEQQDKVYTDSFYVYDNVDNIIYTAADYPRRSSMRNVRIYDEEANIIGRVEEIFHSSSDDNLDSSTTEQPDAKLYFGQESSMGLEQGNRGIYRLSNGWSAKRNFQGTELTIFSASSAVAQVSRNYINRHHLFTDAIYFYADINELQTLMIVLAIDILLMPDKDNKNNTTPDIKSYKEDLKLLTEQRDLRQKLFLTER